MNYIPGLEKHKLLYDSLQDFSDMLEKNESFTDLQIKDLSMRLRYAVETITQQYARAYELQWTTPFDIINSLRRAHVISWEDANILHMARRIANEEGAHINDEKSPLELIVEAYQGVLAFVPKFLADIPEPSEKPLLKLTDVAPAVKLEEEENKLPLFSCQWESIPMVRVDDSRLNYREFLEFDSFAKHKNSGGSKAYLTQAPHNGNLADWLYFHGTKENPYLNVIPQGTFIRRNLLARDYVKQINKLITDYNQKGVTGKHVYIPGIIQEFLGCSRVYFEGETLQYAPVEPAVILRDYALFWENVELPDCVTHIAYNDLLKQVDGFTLHPEIHKSVFSRVQRLVLPKGKWGDRIFLRCFTDLKAVFIQEVGEIDPTPATGEPTVFPSVIRNPKSPQERASLVAALQQDPKFIAYMETAAFERRGLNVGKFGTDTVYVPAWEFDAQKRFGIHVDLVYLAACGVKKVPTEPIRKGPDSSNNGFRGFTNEAEKQALVRSLMEDPDFIDFVNSRPITRKEIWVREGKKTAEPYLAWMNDGVRYMNAHGDAIYEAGCRLKGLDPAPVIVEKGSVTYKKATPVVKKAAPAAKQKASAYEIPPAFFTELEGSVTFDSNGKGTFQKPESEKTSKQSANVGKADKKAVGKMASLLGKLFGDE